MQSIQLHGIDPIAPSFLYDPITSALSIVAIVVSAKPSNFLWSSSPKSCHWFLALIAMAPPVATLVMKEGVTCGGMSPMAMRHWWCWLGKLVEAWATRCDWPGAKVMGRSVYAQQQAATLAQRTTALQRCQTLNGSELPELCSALYWTTTCGLHSITCATLKTVGGPGAVCLGSVKSLGSPPARSLHAAWPQPDLLPFVSNDLPILKCSHSLQPHWPLILLHYCRVEQWQWAALHCIGGDRDEVQAWIFQEDNCTSLSFQTTAGRVGNASNLFFHNSLNMILLTN